MAVAGMQKEIPSKYPPPALASQKLISFPSSYLVECGFSVVADLLHAKRNQLEITKRGDMSVKDSPLERDESSIIVVTGGRPGPSSHCSLSKHQFKIKQ